VRDVCGLPANFRQAGDGERTGEPGQINGPAASHHVQRPTRSSLATDRSSTLIPDGPKLIWARAAPAPPSIFTITPSPNLACATVSPMRQPELLPDFWVSCWAILLSLPALRKAASSQAVAAFLLANQWLCTRGESHLSASSGSSSKKRDFML